MPKTRTKFWRSKFEQNVQRDREQRRQLRRAGWKVIVVWECELRDPDRLRRRLLRELSE
jgi:DNA mismatch endonuclease (patch repair protein)